MSLKIIRQGIHDTVQDEGRFHYRHLGINPNGPADSLSAFLSNALLGKNRNSALIELHFPAAVILFEKSTIICISGADFSPHINGVELALNHPAFIPAGSVLEFKKHLKGSWCYLSLIHEMEITPWLGSCSTNRRVGAGGFKGRKLKENDRILFKPDATLEFTGDRFINLHWSAKDTIDLDSNLLDFIKGNEWHWLTKESGEQFSKNIYALSHQSDRMGYRIEGPQLAAKENTQLVSSPVCAGTIQLLPNGQLIVLMADHQTTGGYPRIGYVTTVSLPLLAQQQPGNYIKFRLTSLEEAEKKLIDRNHYLDDLAMGSDYQIKNFINAYLRS